MAAIQDFEPGAGTRGHGPFGFAATADDSDEFGAEEREIAVEYKRRLAGLRSLSRTARAAALNAARNWRAGALKALQERLAAARRIRRQMVQWQLPLPA